VKILPLEVFCPELQLDLVVAQFAGLAGLFFVWVPSESIVAETIKSLSKRRPGRRVSFERSNFYGNVSLTGFSANVPESYGAKYDAVGSALEFWNTYGDNGERGHG
jgi:hypothetical protein